MGTKRTSIRTLPSGEKVRHEPPDEVHPEGKMTLIPESNLRNRLADQLADTRDQHQALKQDHLDRIDAKKAEQTAKGLPPEKSAI